MAEMGYIKHYHRFSFGIWQNNHRCAIFGASKAEKLILPLANAMAMLLEYSLRQKAKTECLRLRLEASLVSPKAAYCISMYRLPVNQKHHPTMIFFRHFLQEKDCTNITGGGDKHFMNQKRILSELVRIPSVFSQEYKAGVYIEHVLFQMGFSVKRQ